MKNYWRAFWIYETGTCQQAAHIHDSHMMMMMMMMIMIVSTLYQYKKICSK